MTRYQTSVQIAAPAATVWAVLTDVEAMPRWTASMTRVRLIGPAPLAVGSVARIRQPRLPEAEWRVTEYNPGVSFSWESRSIGVTTVGIHRIEPAGAGVTVSLSIEQRGPLSPVISVFAARITRHYLSLEAAGLKRQSEAAAQSHSEGTVDGV